MKENIQETKEDKMFSKNNLFLYTYLTLANSMVIFCIHKMSSGAIKAVLQ